MVDLKIGQEISFKEIRSIFKCGNMGGMLYSKKTNTMVIINNMTKKLYMDRWEGDILYYTGTGTKNDQELTGNPGFKNGILYNLGQHNIEVHLFEVLEDKVYTYRGVVERADVPYQEKQIGEDGIERKVWIFPLKVKTSFLPKEFFFDLEINLYDKIKLNEDINRTKKTELPRTFEYKEKPKEKVHPVIINSREIYQRNRNTALNALLHAGYFCEIDKGHTTFKRRNLDINYMEPHHLVPMEFSKDFDVSLDVEENIVSLCSTCHNWLHYGKNYEPMLKKLYEERVGLLKQVGIYITFEKLKSMY